MGTTTIPRTYNRIAAVMEHIPWYSIQGQARLAEDAGVSRSAVSRLVSGKAMPSLSVLLPVTRALEKRLGKPLDVRDLVSLDGRYPTPSVCTLMACRGNHPYNRPDKIMPEAGQNAPEAGSEEGQ